MVGGFSSITAAYMIGPRKGRFDLDKNGKLPNFEGHSVVLSALGTLILWLGWYGFNPGSTLAVSGGQVYVAARAAVNTSIATCTAGMATVVWTVFLDGKHDLWAFFNGMLSGLVAITAPCGTIDPWGAFVTGIVSSLVVRYSSKLTLWLRIDDAVDAFAVHGCCGYWGLIATGLFSNQANIDAAHQPGIINYSVGRQLGVQLLGGLVIACWSAAITAVELIILKRLFGTLRVTADEEEMGLDYAQFGSYAYPDFNQKAKSAQEQYELEMQRAAAKRDKLGTFGRKEESESSGSASAGKEAPAPPSPKATTETLNMPSVEEETDHEKQMRAAANERMKQVVIGRSSIIDVTSSGFNLDETKTTK